MEKQKHQKKSDYRFKNGILYKNKEPISEWGTPRKYRYPYIIFTPQNNKVSGLFAGQTIDTNRINQTYLPTQSKETLPPHLQRICKAEHRIKQIDDNDFDFPETEADKKDHEVQSFKREQANKKVSNKPYEVTKNGTKQFKINGTSSDLLIAVENYTGEKFKADPTWDNTYTSKNNRLTNDKFCVSGSPDKQSLLLYNHETEDKIRFYLANGKSNKILPSPYKVKDKKPKEIKDRTSEFEKLDKVDSHPYLLSKYIKEKPKLLDLRIYNKGKFKGSLCIPYYSIKTHKISGWQIISSTKDIQTNKFKKWVSEGSSNRDIYLLIPIESSNRYYITEGLATGLSIQKITNHNVVICFGKNNLNTITRYFADKFNDKEIVVCLDHDINKKTNEDTTAQLEPDLIKRENIHILRPELAGQDFNDCQFSQVEIDKLQTLSPVYIVPKIDKKIEIPMDKNLIEFKEKLESCNYKLRENIRAGCIEIYNFDNNKEWLHISTSDYSYAKFSFDLKQGKQSDKLFEKLFKATAYLNRVDPFKLWLKELPEWDTKPRLSNLLNEVFEVEKPYIPLGEWAIKGLLLGCVWRTYQAGYKFDQMPILISEKQGIGKSGLLNSLVPNEDLFTDSVNFSMELKKIVEACRKKLIVEIAELSGFRKTDIDKMKAILSSRIDTLRLSYGKDAKDLKRQFVFCGTSNSLRPLPNDLTGLRRFVPIKLKKRLEYQDVINFVVKQRTQLWAEAVYLYNKKESARLPQSLWNLSEQASESNRGGNESFEYNLNKEINTPDENNILENYIYLPEVLNELQKKGKIRDQNNRQLQTDSGVLLRNWGWDKTNKRINGVLTKVWIRPKDNQKEKTTTEQKQHTDLPPDNSGIEINVSNKKPDLMPPI